LWSVCKHPRGQVVKVGTKAALFRADISFQFSRLKLKIGKDS